MPQLQQVVCVASSLLFIRTLSSDMAAGLVFNPCASYVPAPPKSYLIVGTERLYIGSCEEIHVRKPTTSVQSLKSLVAAWVTWRLQGNYALR